MYRRPPGGAGYGYGYGRRGRRADGSSLVSLLLFNLFRQLQQLEHKPPGLLLLLGLNVAVFFFGVPTTTRAVCIWPRVMVGDPASFAFRSFAAAFTHADEVHLYYNMSSLIYKGYLLERPHRYPTLKLLLLVLELVVVSSLIYVGIAALVPGLALMESCAVGFSAVLFGLKVVLQDVEAREHTEGAYRNVSWGELLLGQFFSMQYGGMTSMGTAVGIDLERRGLALRASHASTHRRIDATLTRATRFARSLGGAWGGGLGGSAARSRYSKAADVRVNLEYVLQGL